MTLNPRQSKQAQIASLVRRARAAEAAGRVPETIAFLREIVQLDPYDRVTLHRLGDLCRLRLNRLGEAGTWYARAARAQERDDLPARAIAIWRIVLQCNPLHVEAHERIGALYAETGRLADARLNYQRSERILREAGLGRDAAILRARREALDDAVRPSEAAPPPVPAAAPSAAPSAAPAHASAAASTPEPRPGPPASAAEATPAPDADALDLAAERLANGRSFHHYGLHSEARRQLEELVAMLPEHVEARQLLVEVCRAVGDADAAARHLGVLMQVMRREGQAEVGPVDEPLGLPPMEDWQLDASDPFSDLMDDIRGDVERLVDHLQHKGRPA